MNIVQSGNKFSVYGEEITTYNSLPPLTYRVRFNKMTGFYLTQDGNLHVEEKIYGSTPKKVRKILDNFTLANRNMGVILSGPKGVGKSIFARQLAMDGNAMNLPLLIVDGPVPGLADFIHSIEQTCIVLFDEFDKTFMASKDEGGYDPQVELLSLFDGIDDGKKLFVITCNETFRLNTYLLNRPGRFHYHIILGLPTEDEIKEYLYDSLHEEYHNLINKLVILSRFAVFTYDALRAICFEINNGYSLEETLADLNIERNKNNRFDINVLLSDGRTAISNGCIIEDVRFNEWFTIPHSKYKEIDNIRISFPFTNLIPIETGYIVENLEDVQFYYDTDWEYDVKDEKRRAEIMEVVENTSIEQITMTFSHQKTSDGNKIKYIV